LVKNRGRFSGPPRAGCDIGFSRVTQYVLGGIDTRTIAEFLLNRELIL